MIEVYKSSTPPVVSKRNESFSTADEIVQQELLHVPEEARFKGFEQWLTKYTEGVIRRVGGHFGEGARRGIEQTAELLCDPEFYATKRQRNEAWRKDVKEDRERQEREMAERRLCPTAEQVKDQLEKCRRQLEYHKEEIQRYEAAIDRLSSYSPRNFRLVPKGNK